MEKLICKVRVDARNVCYGCLDDQIRENSYKSCEHCELKNREYEILKVGHSLFIGDWAMVLGPDGTIKRVALDRVYDVKRVSDNYGELCMKLDKLLFQLDRQVGKVWNI